VKLIPSVSKQDAFQPALEILVADELLRYFDMDVKMSVPSCISEIIRVKTIDQPYNDSIFEDSTTPTVFFAQNWKSDWLPVFLLTKLFYYVTGSLDFVVFMNI